MRKSRLFISSFAVAALLTTTACVTDPNTGEKKVSRTAIGGVGGADGQAILVNLPNGVTFDVDSSPVKPQFQQTLDTIANSLVTYPNSLIDVMGHTDSTGSDEYNLALSQRRANAVADYLVMRGVSRARVATIGYGERYPVADNNTEYGRAQNRRVELKITPISQDEVNAARRGN